LLGASIFIPFSLLAGEQEILSSGGMEIAAALPTATYEVRIEKRVGKRRVDAKRWNALGMEGWMLVAVVGKQAFFRRELAATGFLSD
jgi:hypothetical protein